MSVPLPLPQPSVQSFMNPSLSGGNEWCAAIDTANNRIFSTGPADVQTYLTSYNFTTGAVNNYTNNTVGLGATIQFQNSMTLDPSGNVWTFDNNLQQIIELIPDISWSAGIVGAGSELAGWSDNTFIWTTVSGTSYLIGSGFARPGADIRDVAAFNISGGVLTTNGTYQNTGGSTLLGLATPGLVYWTVFPFSIYGTEIALGQSQISGTSLTGSTIKNYNDPTIFGAGWTGISNLSSPIYDPNDGNVIVGIIGTGTGNLNLICKLSTITGNIIWSIPVNDGNGFASSFTNSIITNDYPYFLYFAETNQSFYLINTITGISSTSTSTGGIIALDNQVSLASLGCIVCNGNWDTSDGVLTLLNSTPSSGASLCAIYFATAEDSGGYTRCNYTVG